MPAQAAAAMDHEVCLPPEVRQAILRAGMSAPSGDNLQPWRLAWQQNSLLLQHDTTRDTSLYNVLGSAAIIALGAMIETMVIMASTFGYRTEVSYFPDVNQRDIAARLGFFSGGASDSLGQVIFERCVNRKPYACCRLSPSVIGFVGAAAERFGGVSVEWLEGDRGLKRLARLLRIDRLLFENTHLHRQFFSCLRWTKEEVASTRDGLPVETLEIGAAGTRLFHLLRSWHVVNVLNGFGFSRIAGRRSAQLIRRSSAVGVLTIAQPSPESFLDVGRAFQRVWLEATAQGLSLQPMTGVLLLQLRLLLQQTEGLSQRQIDVLASTRDQLASLFDLKREVPVVMFRIGMADSPTARTIRRQISEVCPDAI